MLLKNCSNSACDGVRPSFHRFPTMSSTDAVRSIGIPLGFYSRVSAVAVPFARSVPSRDVARARADPETVPLKRRARALGISRAGCAGATRVVRRRVRARRPDKAGCAGIDLLTDCTARFARTLVQLLRVGAATTRRRELTGTAW
eukprot:31058-Pelagococcus_subviridis.AAC.14